MHDRSRHAFAAETVERPYEQEIEIAPRTIRKHLGQLPAVFDAFAALVLDILAHYRIAHALAPLAELPQLVLRILPFVVGRNPGVDCNSHGHERFLLHPFRVSTIERTISR